MEQPPDFSIFDNKIGLAKDMQFLASMPELCDVTFLVGPQKEPVCAVKAILAARSTVFYKTVITKAKQVQNQAENKRWLFMKRFSDPNLWGNKNQISSLSNLVFTVNDFEPDVFRGLIEYIHTGYVTLQPRTLFGITTAAACYCLPELQNVCFDFIKQSTTVDTVCPLLASSERYSSFKTTKVMINKILEFVDENATEVLQSGSFTLLPLRLAITIIKRKELKSDEFTKYQAALMWAKKFCDIHTNNNFRDIVAPFLGYIQFYKIPTCILMNEIQPLGLVNPYIIMMSLAYQADPESVNLEEFENLNEGQRRRYSDASTLSTFESFSDTEGEFADHSSEDSAAARKKIYVGFEPDVEKFKESNWLSSSYSTTDEEN